LPRAVTKAPAERLTAAVVAVVLGADWTGRSRFGCEFALESGSFVAVVGKASAASTFSVELEWDKPSTP
jgi:hypothetical protein